MFRKTLLAQPYKLAYFIIVLFALAASPLQAQGVGRLTMAVDCDKGESIQAAVNKSREGTTINLSGACKEHVDIDKDRISLIGKPGAKLTSTSDLFSVIAIRGRRVELRNFEIDAVGVANGIHLNGGSWAIIADNEIKNSIENAITVRDGSFGDINNNVIVDNAGFGVFLFIGASANIVGNTIKNSGGVGIAPSAGSHALIFDNKIRDNGAAAVWIGGQSGATINYNTIEGNAWGIGVVESGSALITGNTITGNGGAGVSVERNASVEMPSYTGGANLLEGNGWYGLLCGKSGSLIGVPQDFGAGNHPADELIDPGCDKIGY